MFYRLHQERPHAPNWNYSRVGFIDGKMVAHVGIWPFEMQLANGIVIKCGGIRDVCTDPAYRQQKLGHQMLDDASNFMEKEGIELSVLYAGPRHFYEEKGWHGSVPSFKFTVDLAGFDDSMEPTIDLDEMSSYDEKLVDEMCRIRNESMNDLSFVVIRDDAYFHRLIQTDFDFPKEGWTPYLVRDRATGSCTGYLLGRILEAGKMAIVEARVSVEDDDATYLAIFCALKNMLGCTTLELHMSPNHAICKAAAKFAGIQDQSSPISGAMVKLVSLSSFFAKIAEALNIQVKNGKREELLRSMARETSIKLSVFPAENNASGGQEFIMHVDPSADATSPIQIMPASSSPDESIDGFMSVSEEMLVTIITTPSLSIKEAMDDDLLHLDGVEPAIADLLLRSFSWDKEHRDYF